VSIVGRDRVRLNACAGISGSLPFDARSFNRWKAA
jgi:hypothetical protein